MRTIWSLLRTELSAHAAALRTFAVVAIIISTANLAMGGATPAITVCVLTVAFLPSILFAQDERMHLDAMYSILPVTRSQFVVSRYLLVALVTAVMALASLVVARVEAAVHGPGEVRVPVSVPAVTGMAVPPSRSSFSSSSPWAMRALERTPTARPWFSWSAAASWSSGCPVSPPPSSAGRPRRGPDRPGWGSRWCCSPSPPSRPSPPIDVGVCESTGRARRSHRTHSALMADGCPAARRLAECRPRPWSPGAQGGGRPAPPACLPPPNREETP